MNTYERGYIDGLEEAYRLMCTDEEIDLAPGKILTRIKGLKAKFDAPASSPATALVANHTKTKHKKLNETT